MKTLKTISKILFAFFINLVMFLMFGHTLTTVQAISKQNIVDAGIAMQKYDGISNWKEITANEIGKIPIGGNYSLGYTFGAARDSNGKVVGGDTTVTKKSSATTVKLGQNSTAPGITNSKINVFLDNDGKYYGILHQGEDSFIGPGGKPQNASDTSIDYALNTGQGDSNFYSDNNLLAQFSAYDGTNSKILYKSTDANNRAVYKIVGYYYKQSIYAEIVLRPAPSGAPVVQRELYVYNPSTNTSNAQFQTFYGEDTGLDPYNDPTQTVDNVPMYSIGNKSGLYLLSGIDASGNAFDPASKLFITNDLNGGFKDFMGRVLTNPGNWGVKGKSGGSTAPAIGNPTLVFSSDPTSTQNGDTNTAAGTDLLTDYNGNKDKVVDGDGKQDSAYTLRWPYITLTPGSIAGFSSNIGATIEHYAIPTMKMTYTGPSGKSGPYTVGDNLTFTIKIRNDGYNSNWIIKQLLDNMPQGLTITSASTDFSNNSIDYTPQSPLGDGEEAIYTIKAQINNTAPYNLDSDGNLTNKASVTGYSQGLSDTRTLTDSVKIPVKAPAFKYRFTQQVRNNTTDPNGEFKSQVDAKPGDKIDYQVNFVSNGTSTVSSPYFYNVLPNGLKVVPNSVTWNNGTGTDDLYFPMGSSFTNNTTYTINYQAEVTSQTEESLSNTATLLYGLNGSSTANNRINTEEPAIVNVKNSPKTAAINDVPSKISFGSINSLDSERMLKNVSTTGKLTVTHTQETPFKVSVSYDNDGDGSMSSNGNKLVQDGGDTLLISQKQGDSNIWQPLSSTPVPIDTNGFTGSPNDIDLTNYVAANKWQLRVPGNSKAGQYNGTITWSMTDTL
ncbi:isopeptide-forming domain-containing fimbrial protein [Companilactobacillus sp. HBUAS59699]|uniref:isopeptide-forming domain-containing fimbrial protein n=1 Tax=Companilactobacillus sp. HBUAS59699 TaxID=3109358 RepID=UPI002FF422F3